MAGNFYRNQNPSERLARWNDLADRVDDIAVRLESVETSGLASGGSPAPSFDPGDLSVYYQNGKA